MTSSSSSRSLQIICLQTRLTHDHYRSYSALKGHLIECIRQARKDSTLPGLIILPECCGTWFYLMSFPIPQWIDRNSMFRRYRHSLFVLYTLLRHLPSFFIELYRNWHVRTSWFAWIQRSFLTLVARPMKTLYQQFFAELARESQCTVVAGSIFTFDHERFANISCVFEPEHGSICLQSGKEYPVADEMGLIDRSPANSTIYSIPSTDIDIAVLICADSWMAKKYDGYRVCQSTSSSRRRRFLFIIVALNLGPWDIPWPGYDRYCPMPNDVRPEHLREFSLGEAWRHYAVERAFRFLAEQNDSLPGYGVVCCQGLLNLFDQIYAEGESRIILQRSIDEETFFLNAETFRDERILICDF